MGNGLFAAKRVSTGNAVTQIGDVDAGVTFTGLVPDEDYIAQFPDGTETPFTAGSQVALNLLNNTTVINSSDGQISYVSPDTFTADPTADLLLAVVTVCNTTSGPNEFTLTLGAEVMVPGPSYIQPLSPARPLIFTALLAGGDIPSGANLLTVDCATSGVEQSARAMFVEFIEFKGADPNGPVYSGVGDYFASGLADMPQTLAMQGEADHHLGFYTQRPAGSSVLPSSANVDRLVSAETGFETSKDVALIITHSAPGIVGDDTHLASWAVQGQTSTFSIGVKAQVGAVSQ